ncbi:MAG: hypothetical protein WAP35_03750 [Solirubrobacterales bacterium]
MRYSPEGAAVFEALVEDWKRRYPEWVPKRHAMARESLIVRV